jgi:16S rRNA (cytosine1402-N4)-methyltransferase
MDNYHTPVLLKEAIDFLDVQRDEKYIDATIGGGGHTEEILKRGGLVLGIDADQDAIDYVGKRFGSNGNLTLVQSNFKGLEKVALSKNFNKVAGILFDLGVSSHQIDTPGRGFSFLKNGPLDMRMDKNSPVTAEALINLLGKGELYELFHRLGQERRARPISNSIIRARRIKAIKTTEDLVEIIAQNYGIKGKITDFRKNLISQKVFQALRIAVNEELENLKQALPQSLNLLKENGRLAVISFHSLEDGIVKDYFKNFEKERMGKIITKKPVKASFQETENNPKAKGASLRVFEKISI